MPDREAYVVVCDAATLRPEVATVEALARLAIGARRLGCRLCLGSPSPELRQLIEFMGLDDVLGCTEPRDV